MEVTDEKWMERALVLAGWAEVEDEVPVGAVLVAGGEMIAEGWNRPVRTRDPSAHAEIEALRNAGREFGNYRMPGTTLYVTLEPCLMCVGAIVHARVERLVFGAADPKSGAVVSKARMLEAPWLNHRVEYEGGVLAEECGALLQEFFSKRR